MQSLLSFHPGKISYVMPKRSYAGSSTSAPKRRRLWLRKSRLASIGAMAALGRGRVNRAYHQFKRVTQASSVACGSTGAIEFRLNELPNYTEFTNLFDKFRIKGVSVRFVPRLSSYDANPSATYVYLPTIHTAIDYNDSTAPANALELMQYDTYKMSQGGRGHTRYLKPRVSNEVFRTALTTNYAMGDGKQWLDCTVNGADLPHFCLKWVVDNGAVLDGNNFLVFKTFHLEFLGTK